MFTSYKPYTQQSIYCPQYCKKWPRRASQQGPAAPARTRLKHAQKPPQLPPPTLHLGCSSQSLYLDAPFRNALLRCCYCQMQARLNTAQCSHQGSSPTSIPHTSKTLVAPTCYRSTNATQSSVICAAAMHLQPWRKANKRVKHTHISTVHVYH